MPSSSHHAASDLDFLIQQASASLPMFPDWWQLGELPTNCLTALPLTSLELSPVNEATSPRLESIVSLDSPTLDTSVPSLCGSRSDSEPAASAPSPPSVRHGSAKRSPSSRVSKRVSHHQVERKYRDRINRQLERLRNIVPSTRGSALTNSRGKLSKNVILASAIDYIAELQEKTRRLECSTADARSHLTIGQHQN